MKIEKVIEILEAIVSEASDEGCEDCFVVSADLIKKAERTVRKYHEEAGK
jgi:hypothetical protein